MVNYNAFPEVKYSLIRSNRLVTKRFEMTSAGLNKIGNPPGISGDVETRYIPLNELILNQNPRVCHAYGLVSPDIGHKVPIAPKAFSGGDVKARTKEHFSFYDGPGVLFLDNDPNPNAVPPVAAYAPDELMSLLEKHVPGIGSAVAYVSAHSSGAGDIIESATGETLRHSRGIHVYLAVDDARESPRIGETIFKRLWLAGYGSIGFAKNGAMLVRCPIDGSVFSPERIDYTCPAILGPGLERKPLDALPQRAGVLIRADEVLDLTAKEHQQYAALVSRAKAEARSRSDEIRSRFTEAKTLELINDGVDPQIARETAMRACGESAIDLYRDYRLHFVHKPNSVSVAEVLAHPEEYDGESLADPIEGVDAGLTKAMFFANKGFKPFINSFAHGEKRYFLHASAPLGVNDFFERLNSDSMNISPDELLLVQGKLTQDNLAALFEKKLGGRLLYDHTSARWLVWNGRFWQKEEKGLVFDLLRKLARYNNPQGNTAQASSNFISGAETMAKNSKVFAAISSEFDRDQWMLNTPDGLIDLRTGAMRPSLPSDRLTKCTSVGPSMSGGERFLQFMNEITCGDEELIRFHQVSLGACLSGAPGGHWLLFWFGAGRNGKNTLGDLYSEILGSYCSKIPASTLMSQKYEGHPTEIAQLKGLRLAVSSEIEDGSHWHESRLNELTGDTSVKARVMRGDFFEFTLTHKHLIYGNHLPQIRSATGALKSRLKFVPFNADFVGREDPLLPAKLREEAAFVLGWLLEGHAIWLANGMKLPKCAAIDNQSADYFENQSTVETWIAERTERCPYFEHAWSKCVQMSELYADFTEWKKSRGENCPALPRFAAEIKLKYEVRKSNGVRVRGIRLVGKKEANYRRAGGW
jgi:putative DNA primase/helicase